jgi:hypothetical protein
MNQFTAKYSDHIAGTLSGFDRLVFRGTLRQIAFVNGLEMYLAFVGVLFKDFMAHALGMTNQIKAAWAERCKAEGIEARYLDSAAINKEAIALQIAADKQIARGPICLLSVVEPCQSFDVHRDRAQKKLEIVSRQRKCLHLYYYCIHPTFGFMNARIQTWFPFRIQVCINGREWLSRQMDAQGLQYLRHDNCFTWVEDFTKAQELLDTQLRADWPALLNEIARTLNPIHDQMFGKFEAHYYWSTYQSEWATDVVFKDPATLRRLYPLFIRHGMSTLASADVMRFLGKRLTSAGAIPAGVTAEIVSDIKQRQEGVRIKHRVNSNAVKAYDKSYTEKAAVLRAETTVNDPSDFKVYRAKEGAPEEQKQWRKMRKGIADLHRLAEISRRSNERYLEALSSVDESLTLEEVTSRVTQPTTWNKKRVRALRLFDPEDLALLQAVSRGEFAISGLRNADLQAALYGERSSDPREARRRCAAVCRRLRMLRAHGILHKVPHTHRYQVSSFGHTLLTALLTARHTPISQLLPKAA